MTSLAGKLQRARYLLKRIAESPPSFLALKASIELTKRIERSSVERASQSGRSFSEGYEGHCDASVNLATAIRGDILLELSRTVSHGFPQSEIVTALAGDFDRGQWNCLGYGSLPLDCDLWHTDDLHGHTWKREHFSRVDYVATAQRCDVKIPWERSRMQWFVCAALANHFDDDEERCSARLACALQLFRSWTIQNPYGLGVNWVSSMEVAIRAVNLLMAFALIEPWIEPADRDLLLRTVGEHRRYIRRFPETSDVQGNHYLATELGALFMEAFRGDRQATQDAAQKFAAACKGQFNPAGVHIEFSPTYHRLSLDMVLIGRALMARVAPAFATQLDDLLARGLNVCRQLSGAAEELPLFGDNDSGKILDVGQSTRRFGYCSVHYADAALATPCTLSESVLGAVLNGLTGHAVSRPQALPVADDSVASAAPFVIVKAGAQTLVVKAGELGLAGRASHDHDDQLSFWYSIGATDVIVEAGCPPYTLDQKDREAAISSSAHNVIAAAGGERFRATVGSVCKTLRGGPRAEVVDAEARTSPERSTPRTSVRLLRPSSNAMGCPAEHVRSFELDASAAGRLVIEDKFRMQGNERFDSRLHFLPGVNLTVEGSNAALIRIPGEDLELRVRVESPAELALHVTDYTYHPEYGQSKPAHCLVIGGTACAEVHIVMHIEALSRNGVAL